MSKSNKHTKLNLLALRFDLCDLASLRAMILLAGVLCSRVLCSEAAAEHWPRFRGPNGAGQSDTTGIPTEWTEADFLWKKSLPGIGHSSPVIWDDRVFITSADPTTAEQIVLAFDARTGVQLWEQRYPSEPYHKHEQNSFATSTPAVDNDRLYFLWLAGKTVKLAALNHQGGKLWQRDIGELEEKHGFGTSPVVVGDVVCVANDNEHEAAVTALDGTTGDVRWQVPRKPGDTAFATPCVWKNSSGAERLLTVSTATGLTAFNPETGDVAWHGLEHDLTQRCVSSPILAGENVIVSCGVGGNGLQLIAARPGEDGDAPQEVYRIKQGVPNVVTPVVADDLLFLWHDNGTIQCVDAATGERIWRKRVGGLFHSSPVRIGDRIYGTSMDGEVVVIAADKEYKLLARNPLGEPTQSTPAVGDHRVYFRTDSSLICLGDPAAK